MLFTKFHSRLLLLLSISLTSMGCGGGGNSSTSVMTGPVELLASNWNVKEKAPKVSVVTKGITTANKMWTIEVDDRDVLLNDHLQVFLDMDDNPGTGFQFSYDLWSSHNGSGAEYLVQDDRLYKFAKSYSTKWDWTYVEDVVYEKSDKKVKISVPASTFKNLCNTYNIGVVGRDKDWNIQAYYPKSTSFSRRTIDYCETPKLNYRPVITLEDTSPLVIDLFAPLTVPKAVGYDKEDGDISNNIKVDSSNVDTSKAGTYYITYQLRDSQKLAAFDVQRTVIVRVPTQDYGINWASIVPLASLNGATLKVTNDSSYIFLLLENMGNFQHGQFFFDTDNNTSTGFGMKGGGADFMLEDSRFYKFSGTNANHWSWKLITSSIVIIDNQKTVQVVIPKILFNKLGTSMKIGFGAFDDNWKLLYVMPDILQKYQFINGVNSAPIAVDDVASTEANAPTITIHVLENDRDLDADSLTLGNIGSASHGIATKVGGNIKYTPNTGFTGVDTFWYEVNDGHGHIDTANVTVTVAQSSINHAPDAVEDAVTTSFNVPLVVDVLANDVDADGDVLTVLSFTQPPYGTTALQADGTILFDPQGNVGSISFSYTVSDGRGKTDLAVVTVATVDPSNTAHDSWPTISNENITVKSGQPIFIDVLANDVDADGDVLILDQVDSTSNGNTIKINGGVEYKSNNGFVGTEVFWYGVHDGYGHNGAGKVTVTVVP